MLFIWIDVEIPVGLYAFFEQIVGSGLGSVIRRLWQLHLVFAIMLVGLSLLGITHLLVGTTTFEIMIVISLVMLIVTAIKAALEGNIEARLITAGVGLITL